MEPCLLISAVTAAKLIHREKAAFTVADTADGMDGSSCGSINTPERPGSHARTQIQWPLGSGVSGSAGRAVDPDV